MDHFYYLSGGPYLYTSANIPLKYNVNQIKDFIISKKFIPFPSKSQLFFYDRNDCDLNIHESYPPFDGYEPYKNLNIIARAIIMEPDLVNIWKSIGYSEICDDFNELVFQGSFLTLYPPTKNQDWSFPEFDDIFPKFKKLVEIGFRLNDNIIVDVLQFYEHDLVELGELLWKIFCTIRSDEPESTFIFGLFKAAFDPNRCHGREYILNFLKSKTKDHESFIKQILIHHFKRENLDDINFNTRQKSFIFSPIIYEFLLKNYGSKSDLSLMCFKDILALRIYFDDPKNLDLANISTYTFDYILEVYNLYKESIEYLPEHLELLNRAKSSDVIKPFLENFVPKILQSNDINRSIWLNVLYSLKFINDNCSTFVSGLFAAGDVARINQNKIKQIVTAVAEG
ncbi:20319_t:CDS:2 [Funneliformis geosporum]|nr:20319_t:CDS:2 [Funneliformis geosporum]